MIACPHCSQLVGIKEYDDALWDVYYRIADGRSTWEPLVYTGEEYEDSWDDQHETNYAMMAMEKNMAERGLCPSCGRPDLHGITDDMVMTEEEAQDMLDYWAEVSAERRAGC